jgi:hypothetical protein
MSAKEKVLKFIYFVRNKTYFNAIVRENGIQIAEIVQAEPNNIKGGDFAIISSSLNKAWFKPFNFSVDNLTDEEILKIFNMKREEVEKLTDKIKSSILYVDGKRIVCLLDMNDAIPLYEDKYISIDSSSEFFVKTTETIKLLEDKEKEKKVRKVKSGLPVRLKEIGILPSMLFELLNAHMVTQMNSMPKSKWAELAPVLIVMVIVIGVIFYLVVTSGAIHGL